MVREFQPPVLRSFLCKYDNTPSLTIETHHSRKYEHQWRDVERHIWRYGGSVQFSYCF